MEEHLYCRCKEGCIALGPFLRVSSWPCQIFLGRFFLVYLFRESFPLSLLEVGHRPRDPWCPWCRPMRPFLLTFTRFFLLKLELFFGNFCLFWFLKQSLVASVYCVCTARNLSQVFFSSDWLKLNFSMNTSLCDLLYTEQFVCPTTISTRCRESM